jgi:hypothetical protein
LVLKSIGIGNLRKERGAPAYMSKYNAAGTGITLLSEHVGATAGCGEVNPVGASACNDDRASASGIPPDGEGVSEKTRVLFFMTLGLVLIGIGFLFNTPQEVLAGNVTILTSPANLITDYMMLSNIGAAFVNVGVMLLISLFMVKANGGRLGGLYTAAIFTVAGFSFFGKNFFNSLPITLGVFLFAKIDKKPFRRYLPQALFGTALGPLVSEICFNLGLPMMQGLLLSMACGVAAGFIIPPLAMHFVKYHQGFNLYNIGFTAGIIGMFFMAALRGIGVDVAAVSIISSGNNAAFATILYSLFAVMLLLGLYLNGWSIRGYARLIKESGRDCCDYTERYGFGLAMVNMALLGILTTSYVLIIGGQLNGPTIGGIFTVVGFGATGKHVKNVLPIIIGVLLAKLINIYEHNSTAAILAALFGTTLAPIAGKYGFGCGIVAGLLHMAVTMNIGYLHGGMNLYNNGFSGGFIAAAMVPVIDSLKNSLSTGAKKPLIRKKAIFKRIPQASESPTSPMAEAAEA